MAYAHETRSILPGLFERAHAAARNAVDAWGRHRVYRRTMNELGSLSQRELDDLGISRSTITRVSRDAAYGK